MTSCAVIGAGPSIGLVDWSALADIDCVAVSSGVTMMPWTPRHWVAIDAAEYFPTSVVHSESVSKHVPEGQDWEGAPSIRRWRYEPGAEPNFGDDGPFADGSMALRARTHGIFSGVWQNSVLMTVQVLRRLGYDELHFVGCDFTDDQLALTLMVLREWHRDAERCGYRWFNASPLSHLQVFLPDSERMVLI